MKTRQKLCAYDCCNIIDLKYRVCPCELGECPRCNAELSRLMENIDDFGDSYNDEYYAFLEEPWAPEEEPPPDAA